MHDIDRTQLEAVGNAGLNGWAEPREAGAPGPYGSQSSEFEMPLSETEEMELAGQLLEISSEEELEQFLGNVFRSAQQAAGRFVRSDTGQALASILKNSLKDAARQALPVAGSAIGQWVSPQYGGEAGARIASAAGALLGLELEGLSGEDREFEIARQLVRFASEAVRRAALAPGNVPGPIVANTAIRQAAQTYAPGLVHRLPGRSTKMWPRSGRWVRQGQSIVLFGD